MLDQSLPRKKRKLMNILSVRIGNELGASHPWVAKFSVLVVVTTCVAISTVLILVVLIFRVFLRKLYPSSEDVIKAVSNLTPLLAILIFFNGIQPILSGVAIGSGWQAIVAYVNVATLIIITARTNWNKEVDKVRARLNKTGEDDTLALVGGE